jgi:bile acid:Na+ symporter, BASS family
MESASLIKLLNVVALAAIMLAIGLSVRFEQVAASLRRTRLVVLGVVANFVLVPLVTVALLHCFQAQPLVSAGFLILAVCPGAPVGPSFTSVAKGNVSIATGAMVVLAGLSAVLAPTLLTVLLRWIVPASELTFDYLGIVKILLVTQLLPLGVGLAAHEWLPKLADRIARPLALLANFLLLALVGLILSAQYETLLAIRWLAWLGMLILLLASLIIGWCCGGSNREARRALAVTTGVRNAAVGLAIATTNFAGTPAVTAVVAYALVAVFGSLAFAVVVGKLASRRGEVERTESVAN